MSTASDARAAAPAADVVDSADAARYLTFTLNDDAYALNIFHVTEILEYRQLTVVPMMPGFMRGVINLRGRAVPVIDLAIRFGRGTTSINRRTSIVIVHVTGRDVGVLVDAVNKVEAFAAAGIEPPPAFGAGIRADYISGMARRDNDFIIILDVEHVLSQQELAVTAESAALAGEAVTAGGGAAAAGGGAVTAGGGTAAAGGSTAVAAAPS